MYNTFVLTGELLLFQGPMH